LRSAIALSAITTLKSIWGIMAFTSLRRGDLQI
jgi:hypothetical protein